MKCTVWNHKAQNFKAIREADGLDNYKVSQSLDLDMNIDKIFKAGMGAGKSGSFFFFSQDNKLIIKTIVNSEKKLLMSMIDDINSHIVDSTNNRSLLARIYGLFSIKSAQFSKVSFILMQNTT